MVKRVGNRIAGAITKYYNDKGLSGELAGYKWEFNLVEKKEVDAWCMPGETVDEYTGLSCVIQDTSELASLRSMELHMTLTNTDNQSMTRLG